MKTAAIIAEYNPFHNGHAYQLRKVRELSGADFLLIIMSGDFVQRGTPAIFDKFIRAEMALCCGADLILELPCASASASAPRFAAGAAALLNRLGVIDELWFGSEEGRMEPFEALSDLFSQEPETFQQSLKSFLKTGCSFPAARMQALLSFFSELSLPFESPEALKEFLSSPNNILGLEYCLALKKSGSTIRPRTLARIGSGYHEHTLADDFSSASAIRSALLHGEISSVRSQIPETVYPLLEKAYHSSGVLHEDDFSLLLKYQLLKETENSLCNYLDLPEDLARRILRMQNQLISFSQFAGLLKTRNQTRTNINRALIHILLGLTPKDAEESLSPDFCRILGFSASCQKLMAVIKKHGALPLISKPGDLPEKCYKKELFASSLYESVRALKSGQPFVHEYSRQIRIIR